MNEIKKVNKQIFKNTRFWLIVLFVFLFVFLFFILPKVTSITYDSSVKTIQKVLGTEDENKVVELPPLDTVAYDAKLLAIANNPVEPPPKPLKEGEIPPQPLPPKTYLWPAKTVYPNAGAILPFNRVIAYYGNLYSRKMGVLGQYDEEEMLARLDVEVKKWELADPNTPVLPALHYIAVVSQASAGVDGKYRARMPESEINKVLKMAEKINAIVFLDIQVGFSNLQTEVPLLEKYLKLPNVHLGIDPEFSMKTGVK
ncbi:MAG: hypothetical protein M3P22_01705, partial [bacterium]|nr:hypothetical protein [bacterium]